MGHKITTKVIQAAEQLERLAHLQRAEQEEQKFKVKIICTSEPEYIDRLEKANPSGETGAMVTPKGNIMYYIKF